MTHTVSFYMLKFSRSWIFWQESFHVVDYLPLKIELTIYVANWPMNVQREMTYVPYNGIPVLILNFHLSDELILGFRTLKWIFYLTFFYFATFNLIYNQVRHELIFWEAHLCRNEMIHKYSYIIIIWIQKDAYRMNANNKFWPACLGSITRSLVFTCLENDDCLYCRTTHLFATIFKVILFFSTGHLKSYLMLDLSK